MSNENIEVIKLILLSIVEEFQDETWGIETQDKILDYLKKKGVLAPYKSDANLNDRTALVRIIKILVEWLGLLWIKDEIEIIITDAGFELIQAKDSTPVIENQIAKMQYPNPRLTTYYNKDFEGIIPHLFLLQVLKNCDYKITLEEYDLFINLAKSQDDVNKIVNYIEPWRDLNTDQQQVILDIVKQIPIYEPDKHKQLSLIDTDDGPNPTRFNRIHLNSGYQRSFYAFPRYLEIGIQENNGLILCNSKSVLDRLVEERIKDLKVPEFKNVEDWFAYYGDPNKRPNWFNFVIDEIEKASSEKEAEKIIKQHKSKITKEDLIEVQKKRIEKRIEDFYAGSLDMLEKGLKLIKKGRQYSTPIGRIDLLCMSKDDEYVVIEIKVAEADDNVFGQILRYIGWVHRNMDKGRNNVRGIILAGLFNEKAKYSRIGLLKKDYNRFIGFKKHGLNLSDE